MVKGEGISWYLYRLCQRETCFVIVVPEEPFCGMKKIKSFGKKAFISNECNGSRLYVKLDCIVLIYCFASYILNPSKYLNSKRYKSNINHLYIINTLYKEI